MRLADKDFGTPAVDSDENVTLEINGIEITAATGTSIMRAAASSDIQLHPPSALSGGALLVADFHWPDVHTRC